MTDLLGVAPRFNGVLGGISRSKIWGERGPPNETLRRRVDVGAATVAAAVVSVVTGEMVVAVRKGEPSTFTKELTMLCIPNGLLADFGVAV